MPSDRFIAGMILGWCVAFTALLAYWLGMEAAEAGQQYADPLLPCAWLAAIFGWPIGAGFAVLTRCRRGA